MLETAVGLAKGRFQVFCVWLLHQDATFVTWPVRKRKTWA